VERAGCLIAALALSCSSSTSDPRFETTPGKTQLFVSLVTVPPAGADGVARNATLRITFDAFPTAYPDPDTAKYGPIVLRSGHGNFDIDVRVELVGRPEDDYRPAIVVQPHSPLEAMTHYELAISPALRALDGRTVGQVAPFPIDVGMTLPDALPPPTPQTWNGDLKPRNSGIGALLGRNCGLADCHSRQSFTDPFHFPTRRLDLAWPPEVAPDDPVFGIIGVPSVSLAGTPEQLVRVAPGDSARSLLLRKLLTPNPTQRDKTVGELRVPGRRMPLLTCQEYPNTMGCTNFDSPDPLPNDALRVIQEWIDQGAPL
jgi:hypothetical protein